MPRRSIAVTPLKLRVEPTTAPTYSIGEAARLSGCTPEAIRYYEREGVVPSPSRHGTGRYRHYRGGDINRLRFLRRARELGFSLADVRDLLALAEGNPSRRCVDVDRLATAHLGQVEAKIAQLSALRDRLADVIGQCQGGFAVSDCRILGALGDA